MTIQNIDQSNDKQNNLSVTEQDPIDLTSLTEQNSMLVFDESNDETTLPTTGKIPWLSQFELGSGISAFSGALNASPFKIDSVTPNKSASITKNDVHSITSSEDIQNRLSASVKGSFNVYGVDISGSVSFLKDVKTNNKTISYILEYFTYRDVNLSSQSKIMFEDDPKALINKGDWAIFRERYGDYHVSGYREESQFVAVYVLTAQKSSELTEFKAKLSASKKDIFSASAGAEFKSLCASENIEVSVSIYERGTDGSADPIVKNISDPSVVGAKLKAFQKNMKPQKMSALLTHYSVLIPSMPTKVKGDPQIIFEIEKLYSDILYGNGLAKELPSRYQEAESKALSDLLTKVTLNGDSLYSDPDRLSSLQRDVSAWYANITKLLNYKKFCLQAKRSWDGSLPHINSLKNPGDSYPNNNGDAPRKSSTYGLSGTDIENVVISSITKGTGRIGYKIGHRKTTINFDLSGHVVVGITVTPNWQDGTDGYWCLASGGFGKQNLEIGLNSQYDRGMDYSVTVHTIEEKYFSTDT